MKTFFLPSEPLLFRIVVAILLALVSSVSSSPIIIAQMISSDRLQPKMHSMIGQSPGSGLTEKELYRQWRKAQGANNPKRIQQQDQSQRQIDAQTILIDEGFEGGTFPPSGWTTVATSGDSIWVSDVNNAHSGSQNAFNWWSDTGTINKKYLITKRVTLNGLLLYRLKFWVKREFSEPFDPDTLYIKLSTSDSLLASFTTKLYKCYTGPDTSTNPNIYTTTYKQFTVEFSGVSGTGWLAFDHEDINGQGLDLDDVRLEEIVNNDILAFSVDDPLAAARKNLGIAFQPKATFKNNGVLTQTNIPVRFKIYNEGGAAVYNTTQTIASLAPNVSTQVTFSSFTPSAPGNYTARAIAQNAGDTDPSNDSVGVQFRIPDDVFGTRTVGPGGNFTTLNDAVRFLGDNNVAGPLTFTLISNVFTEPPLAIDQIYYTTTQQPVVIKPSSGFSPMVTISATPSNPFGLRLKGTSNLTIDGSNNGSTTRDLIFNIDTAGFYAPGLLLTNGCKSVTVKNLIVKGYSKSDGSANTTIVLDSLTAGKKDSNIVFDNLQLMRAFNGFFLRGPSTRSFKVTISNCEVGGSGVDVLTQAGVIAYNVDSLSVFGNDIKNIFRSQGIIDLYGIFVGSGATNANIYANKIHAIENAVNTYYAHGIVNNFGGSSNLKCYNNFIYNVLSRGSGTGTNFTAGIYSSNSANTNEQYYYNSIFFAGNDSSTSSSSLSACMILENGASAIQMKNNVVVNAMTFSGNTAGNKGYCVYLGSSVWPAGSSSNYNNLYTSGAQGVIGFINSANRNTLAEWQAATGQDGNSLSVDPLFKSSNDLHIQVIGVNSLIDGKGTPIAGITKDIDAELRNTLTPDIGADEFTPQSGIAGNVSAGWNMVSLPVVVADSRVSTIFPVGRISNAYTYIGNSYVKKDTLIPGIGYWLKFSSSQSVAVSGVVRNRDTVQVVTGWNMVGSLSTTIPRTSVVAIAGAQIKSSFFGYSGAYQVADSLRPFKSYWVKMSQPGKLVMAVSGSSLREKESPASGKDLLASLNELNWISIQDAAGNEQKLYFGISETIDEQFFELPPPAPSGMFDARFASQSMVGILNPTIKRNVALPIVFSSVVYPINIKWQVHNSSKGSYSLLSREDQVIQMNQKGSVQISNPAVSSITLKIGISSAMPMTYSLMQNYPNPFNPSTVIRYTLPTQSYVKMIVINCLGQEIAKLVDVRQESGLHSIEWVPDVASGIYYYRMEATDMNDPTRTFMQVQKMVLVK